MFNISDKVVCIDDRPGLRTGIKELTKGTIYVIRDFPKGNYFNPGVYIVGIYSPFDKSQGEEIPLKLSRFRKLDDIKKENSLKYYLSPEFDEKVKRYLGIE